MYFRDNVAGVQREWWQHRTGCGEWFLAERDTRTNEVLEVMLPDSRKTVVRLERRDGERIDRSRAVSFTFAGWKITGFEGDTIASAAFAAGKRVFSRSFKYHRPRGLLCCSGHCPNCQMTVDGVPERPRLHRADSRGRRRRGPERALVARLRLHVADGQGRRPVHAGRASTTAPSSARGPRGRCTRSSCAAPPGSARSIRTRGTRGATTPSIGGRACSSSAAAPRAGRPRSRPRRRGPGSCSSTRIARNRDLALPGVEVLAPARALGIWEGGLVPVDADTVLYRFRAERIVVATGATEQPLVFPGNDLVGVMLPDGVRRLIRDFSIRPGERAVVLGSDDETLAIADELADVGIEVAKVVDLRDVRPRELAAQGGKGRVRRLVLDGESYDCDLLVASGGRQPAYSLLAQAGARVEFDDALGVFVPTELPDGVEAVGSVTGEGLSRTAPEPAYEGKGKCFVCVCEDVTTKDMKRAIGEGFDSIELAKRYTTRRWAPARESSATSRASGCTRRRPGCTSRRSARRRRGRRGRRSSSACSRGAS